MFRPIVAASLIFGVLTAWASIAQAETRIVFTHHALKLDVHDLDLRKASDQHVLQTRIADAADQVCGGPPDKTNRYTAEELKLLVPAFEKCRGDAIRRAVAAVGTRTRLAETGAGP